VSKKYREKLFFFPRIINLLILIFLFLIILFNPFSFILYAVEPNGIQTHSQLKAISSFSMVMINNIFGGLLSETKHDGGGQGCVLEAIGVGVKWWSSYQSM
jgi:hypothetical protein